MPELIEKCEHGKKAIRWVWDHCDHGCPEDEGCTGSEPESGPEPCLKCDPTEIDECSWCGAEVGGDEEDDLPKPHWNTEGEIFCSPGHRSASNRAKKRLLG